MSNIIDKLKKGDLIAVAYDNRTTPALFHKLTDNSIQFYPIKSWVLTAIKEHKNYGKYYINSLRNPYRVVKLTEDSLTDEDIVVYKEMKQVYDKLAL